MQCNEFVSVIEQEGLAPLPPAAQDHLADCDRCQNYFADLSSIVECAQQLPAEADPPQRIWVSLRAQLESEGLIHEPAVLAPHSSSTWLGNLRGFLTPRALATAGVGIALAFAAFLQLHRQNTTIARSSPAVQSSVPSQAQEPATRQANSQAPSPVQGTAMPTVQVPLQAQAQSSTQPLRVQHQVRRAQQAAPLASSIAPYDEHYVADTAGGLGMQVDASGADIGNPAVDASLRKNLRTVNEFIAECQTHLKKHPQDALAREYLNSALQQKAELIAALLDSGRSEQ